MSEIMRQLLATQATLAEIGKTNADTAKKQVDAITAAKGPRPTQPSFAPKGEHGDYLEFKAFSQKFSYFTKDVKDDKDKLQWLLSSVKNDAYESIKGFSIDSDNFQVAWAKLEKSICIQCTFKGPFSQKFIIIVIPILGRIFRMC